MVSMATVKQRRITFRPYEIGACVRNEAIGRDVPETDAKLKYGGS